jgi:hypothetical protein
MTLVLYGVIAVLASTSYVVGARQMLRGQYAPSTFSRIVWVFIAINSFAGVWASGGSQSSLLLSGIALVGSIVICIISFWKGNNQIALLEYVCAGLLGVSFVVWLYFRAPLANLILSLSAHFIGALPTYKKVWLTPSSESKGFWSLFFLASVLSVLAANTTSLLASLYPIYYTLFDGSIFFLTLRRAK